MHFYQFNISDYRKRTGHLTLLEHAIYRSLIDTYYLEELPLCGDIAKLMRTHSARSKDEKEAFNAVIDEFFVLTDSGYHHEKCDQELAKIYEKSVKARHSAKVRWEKHNAKVMRTHSECNANGMLPKTYDLKPNNLTPKDQEIVPPKEKAKPRTKFKQPESNDVFDYLLTRGIDQATAAIECEKFADYYQSNGWKVGKNSMKCWKSAARNWTKNINRVVANNGTQNGNQPRKSSMLDRVKQATAQRTAEIESRIRQDGTVGAETMGQAFFDVRPQVCEPVRTDARRHLGQVLDGDYTATNG